MKRKRIRIQSQAQEEINEILPHRDQYLVSTSEFDDIKARLNTALRPLKAKTEQEGQPTLIKREPKDESTTPATSGKDSSSPGDDQPPVLRRRD